MEAIMPTPALPNDVLADVLGRLPLRSLAVWRCVCKPWRALLDDHRRLLLPRSASGLFLNYEGHRRPHFFARPASPDDGPRIDGKFRFILTESHQSFYQVVDHCNGLVLYRGGDWVGDGDVMYVCNPTTRRWARLPPYPAVRRQQQHSGEPWARRAFLVFDPAVSPHYRVLLAPPEAEPRYNKVAKTDASCLMEWPPSPWTWHEFSSSTGRWEEKVFVRDGEAAGTVRDLLKTSFSVEPRRRYAAYWQGELYIHCRGEYVLRLSLLNDKYQVIKSPIDVAKRNSIVRSFLGRSKEGVYFAAINAQLRVWVLTESDDQMGWVPKHHSNLNTNSWWLRLREQKYQDDDGPWILDVHSKNKNKEVPLQQNVCWNSDDDDIIDVSDDEQEESYDDPYVNFLGFHPYKEVIFLCDDGMVVACHLNSSKVQYLGEVHLGVIYNGGQRESFVYTPCLIGG